MKILFRRIHLYLALAAGLVIMVTCLTGAILVFEKELMQVFNKGRYYTTAGGQRLTLDEIRTIVDAVEPGATVSGLRVYSDPKRTVEVSITRKAVSKNNGVQERAPKRGEPAKLQEGQRLMAFVDPYNGRVTELYNHRNSFFYWVMDVHRWMLAGDVGKMVVGVSTIFFLFILITGIVLWWPRNKQILKQRLRIKTDAGFKRLNHDYHVVFGFYSAIFLLIFAFTGLAWSFEWFNKGIYRVTKSSMDRPKPVKSKEVGPERVTAEFALQTVMKRVPDAVFYNLTPPKDSVDAFSISLLPRDAAHESASDTYFVDAFTGSMAGQQLFKDKNTGQRVRATFKPVHVGSIYGLPSKIIGVLACLLGTFFPASGIIMWINRTWKKRPAKANS